MGGWTAERGGVRRWIAGPLSCRAATCRRGRPRAASSVPRVLQQVGPRLAVTLLEHEVHRAHDVARVEVLRVGPRPQRHVRVLGTQGGDDHGGALLLHVRQQPAHELADQVGPQRPAVAEVAEHVGHVRHAADHDAAPGHAFGEVDRLAVDGERDPTEEAEVEAGGGDDDVRLELLPGGEPDPGLGERLDGVGDHRRPPLAQCREQVPVGDDGEALLPRAVAGVEVLVDVEPLGEQRAHRLDEERPQLVRGLEGHPGDLVALGDVGAPEDLVGPLVGDVQGPQGLRQLVGLGAGEEERRRPLEHRHVSGGLRHGRDEGRRRRAGADDDDALAGVVQVVGPLLRVHDHAPEPVHALPLRAVGPGVVVVALAHPQEVGGEPQVLPGVLPGDLHRPAPVLGGPARSGDPVPVADHVAEVVLGDDLVEVGEDLLGGRDRGPAPRLEPVAEGEQVAVRAGAGVPVGPPGPAAVLQRVEDDEGPAGEPFPQVVGGSDAGDPRTDDQHVDVLGLLLGRHCPFGHRHAGPPLSP
jgi:hypothetical protein